MIQLFYIWLHSFINTTYGSLNNVVPGTHFEGKVNSNQNTIISQPKGKSSSGTQKLRSCII